MSPVTIDARDQLHPPAGSSRFERLPPGVRRDPLPHDRPRREPRAQQHVRERGGLRGGIPPVDVQSRIRFGNAPRLHFRQRPSNAWPCSIAVSMKLVVLLTTPRKPVMATAGSVSRTRLKMGMPSMTAPSNRKRRLARFAARVSA